ncbi:hypothetical protein EYY98_20995 [Obesumbacterium proteus]|nr:hypothetical protein EYY98_20995 [Obesumbacterium proteus]
MKKKIGAQATIIEKRKMHKKIYISIIFLCSTVVILWAVLKYHAPDSFICDADFSIEQNINDIHTVSTGILSIETSQNYLFINIDGLLTRNDERYIISRSIQVTYKAYNKAFHLYKVTAINTSRYDSDNIDDSTASDLFFSNSDKNRIIYINKSYDGVMLFGNSIFPQYGCHVR